MTSPPPPKRSEPRPFDFRRPNKLNRDHLRNLEIVFDTFGRQAATQLSSVLRSVAAFELTSIDQLSYDEYISAAPNPAHLTVLDLEPLSGAGMMVLPPSVTFTMIDLLLGGSGRNTVPHRPLTDIEIGLMDTLIDRLLGELEYAFNSLMSLHTSVRHYESNPHFAQIAAPSDMVVVAELAFRLGEAADPVTICVPYQALQPVLQQFSGHISRTPSSTLEATRISAEVEARVGEALIDLVMILPTSTMSARQILDLAPGDLLTTTAAADQPLACRVGDEITHEARPVRRGKRLAAQITRIVEPPVKEQR